MNKLHNTLIIHAAALFFSSCSQTSEPHSSEPHDSLKVAQQVKDDSVFISKDTAREKTKERIDYSYYDAVVIEATDLNEAPSFTAETVVELVPGQQLSILEKSDSAQADEDDAESVSCEFGYYWYKVTTEDKRTGWVYGNRIVQKASAYFKNYPNMGDYLKDHVGEEVMIATTPYYFDAGITLPYEPEDLNGPGCEVHYFPFFYDKEGKIYLIKADQELFVGKDWLVQTQRDLLKMVWRSEGGDVSITNIVKNAMGSIDPKLECSHGYQEGGANSSIQLSLSGNYFKVEDYDFHVNMQAGE